MIARKGYFLRRSVAYITSRIKKGSITAYKKNEQTLGIGM